MLIEPLRILGEVIGGAMSAIADMPTDILIAVSALGMLAGPTFAVGRAVSFVVDSFKGVKQGGMFLGLSRQIEDFGRSVRSADFSGFTNGMGRMREGAKTAASGIKQSMGSLGNNVSSVMLGTVGAYDASRTAAEKAKSASGGLSTAWSGTRTSVKGSIDGIKGAVGGLKGAFSGLAGFIPGLAITGALTLITTAMASMQAGADEATASITDYAASFDREINAFGETSVKHFRDRFEQLNQSWGTELGLADDFKETAEKVGISLDDLAENFSGSKKDVRDYAEAWSQAGADIDNLLNSNSFDFKTKFQATREVMTNLSDETLEKMNITREAIEKMNDVELSDFVAGMRAAGGEALKSIEQIKDFSDELTEINNIDLGNVWDWANNGGAEMDGVRQALSEANEQVGRLENNFKVLGDVGSSAAQKLSAFKDNLKLTGAETFSDTGGLKEYYEGLKGIENAYDKVKEAADGNISSLMTFSSTTGKITAEFDFQQQAARDLHDALSKDAEGIHAIAMSAYDAAIKNGDTVQEATQKAKDAMAGPVSELRNRLTEMGGLSKDQINGIIDQLGLLPEDVDMALSVEGAAEARRQIIETQLAAEAISRKDFKVYLEVMSDEAKAALAEFLNISGEVNEVSIKAALDAGDFDMSYDELMTQVALAPDEVSMIARLEDRATGPAKEINKEVEELSKDKKISVELEEKVRGQIDTVNDSIKKMTENPKDINLKTNARETADHALNELKRLQETNPELNLDIAKFEAEVNRAKDNLISVEDRKVMIDVIDKATPAAAHWNKLQPHAKQVVLDIVDKASPAVEGFNNMELKDQDAVIKAIDEANPKAMAWQNLTLEEKRAVITAHDAASDAVDKYNNTAQLKDLYGNMLPQDDITSAVNDYNLNTYLLDKTGVLKSVDEVTPKVWEVNSQNLQNKEATFNAVDWATPILEGFNNKTAEEKVAIIDAIDQGSPKVGVWNSLSMVDKAALLSAKDEATPKLNSWDGRGISNKQAVIQAIDAATQVQESFEANGIDPKVGLLDANSAPARAVQAAFEAIPLNEKIAILKANNRPALNTQAEFDNLPIEDKMSILSSDATKAFREQRGYESVGMDNSRKEAKITADSSQARYEIGKVNRMGIGNKFFNIAANLTNSARNILNGLGIRFEMGGILPGNSGMQAFANGGFSDPNVMGSIASFAGGTERHVAQIARGQTPYRVWAEPETGGEAYIPLAKSKRKRSMKILEQVAKYFGMSLMKFNKGGIVRRATGSSGMVRTFANGGTDLVQALARDRQTIADGFKSLKLDLFSVFGSPDKSPMVRSMEGIEKTLRDFATEYRKSAPKERAKALQAVTLLTSQQKLSKAWSSKYGQDFTADFIAKQARFNEGAPKGGKTIPLNKLWTMADMEKALSILTKKLEDQKAILERIKSDRDSMQKSIADNLFSSFNLSDTIQNADSTGWRPPTSAADIATYAKNKLTTMKKYNSTMKSLIKAGYNQAIVMDIASMKPEDAIYLAEALLKDKSYMSSINSAYTQMFGAGGNKNINGETGEGYTAGLANSTGKFLADSFYGLGISAQQGLVNGLTKDVSALEKAARIMADQLTNTFKSIMGIKSPSRVMMKLGKFIPEGLALGIDSGTSMVSKSMTNMVRASDFDITARPVGYTPRHSNGIIGGASSAGPTIHVHPSQGLSEEQIGQAASRELLHRTLG